MELRKIFFFCLIILCGCSGKWHANQAKKHELLAEAKGVKISHDTVYKDKIITVLVPGDSGSVGVNPALDTGAFESDINKNDSLVHYINSLETSIGEWDVALSGATIDKEKALGLLMKANRELAAIRKRIIQGYSKDSTYVFTPDSVTSISVEVKNGLVNKLNYKRKETTLTTKERIPIEIRKVLELGYTHWQLLAAVLLLFVLGFIVGRLTKSG